MWKWYIIHTNAAWIRLTSAVVNGAFNGWCLFIVTAVGLAALCLTLVALLAIFPKGDEEEDTDKFLLRIGSEGRDTFVSFKNAESMEVVVQSRLKVRFIRKQASSYVIFF